MKPVFFIIFGCLILASAPASAADLVRGRDWSVNAKPSLVDNSPPLADMRKFVNEVLNADMNPALCSFRFTDVAHDGLYRLLAVLDASGRHLCNELVVIAPKDKSFIVINQWKVWGVDDVSSVFKDLDHDGRAELLLPQSWTAYDGVSRCTATWEAIFSWDNDRYVDRSAAFASFYKERQKDLRAAQERSLGLDRNAICAQMEIDKIDRFLMVDPHAGFTAAEQWMKDPDSSHRRKAAAVFGDIADGPSHEDLATLASDPDTLVAETAKLYLAGHH